MNKEFGKVRFVDPGSVTPEACGFSYSVILTRENGRQIVSSAGPMGGIYPLASAAKQAMRDEVFRLRRKHMI